MHRRKITNNILKRVEDGDDSGGSGQPDTPEGPDTADKPDKGSGWTPPASQEEFDRLISERLARATKKYKDYDEVKNKAARMDELELELASATDKAVHAAREEERNRIASELTPRLVTAEFRAAAKGVLTADQLKSLIEDMDLSRYVTDKGEVDVDRIEKKVAAFAPVKEDPPPPRGTDFGQGRRSAPPAKGVDAGRSRYEATHRKTTT